MDSTVRRRNFLWLIEHRFEGSQQAMAAAWGVSGGRVSQLLDSKQAFGEKVARKIEDRLGLPSHWLDRDDEDTPSTRGTQAGGGMAHDMSPRAFTIPSLLEWGDVMKSKGLPEQFILKMPDGALSPNLPQGTALVFKRAATALPRQCVLVEDATGARYIRRYAQDAGGAWQAQALDSAYISLQSARDGLRILAVMTWRESSEV